MSERLYNTVAESVATLDVRTALNALHYASRLVKHQVSVSESSQSDKLWVAGVPGEPTEAERVLGKRIVQLIEVQIGRTVDTWSKVTVSEVIDMLGKTAATFMRSSWSEPDRIRAEDYHEFCEYLPTVTDPAVEFTALLDLESARSKIETIVNNLPPRERLIFEMRLVQELSWEECADALNISPTAARQLWYRTLRKVRNQLVHGVS
jgi:RNA polymerase sigma factor (sigma-70 family)